MLGLLSQLVGHHSRETRLRRLEWIILDLDVKEAVVGRTDGHLDDEGPLVELGPAGEHDLGGSFLGSPELVPGEPRLAVGQEEEAVDEHLSDDVDVDVDVGAGRRRRRAQRQLFLRHFRRQVEFEELDFPDQNKKKLKQEGAVLLENEVTW